MFSPMSALTLTAGADIGYMVDSAMLPDSDSYDMVQERARARAAGAFKMDYTATLSLGGETAFCGYDGLADSGQVLALLKDGAQVESLAEGEEGVIVLNQTPFYAESGGQAGDSGYLNGNAARFEVRDCLKDSGHHLHLGLLLSGSVRVGDTLGGQVDADVRQATALNHSATHLLHAALRELLGDHVQQKGSLVDGERLRFDFSHFEAVSATELKAIEQLVNTQIRANTPVATQVCDMETAQELGAMALFGEKYGSEVRVLSMGTDAFSVELCGGTHVERTGDIGLLRIVSESGIASGVRRIEAVTGARALAACDQADTLVANAAKLVKANRDNLGDKLTQLVAQNRQLEKDLAALKAKLASATSGDLVSQAVEIEGLKVLAINLEGVDAKSLRDTADQLKNKLGSAVVLLAAVENDKVALVAGVTKDATARIKAGDLMRHVASQLGGKGGGRPDMAQGGGTQVDAVDAVLGAVPDWVAAQLVG